MKIIHICGARPNFMKTAPLLDAWRAYPHIEPVLVHTGQHYDANMSKLFFDELGIPKPDVNLAVGSGSHAKQTAEIMIRLEPVMLQTKPDAALVVGDVNSTIAAALVASKLNIPILHVEAGLRSFDRAMPEEINRVLTDAISEALFITESSAEENLLREGVDPARIHLVGNVMIDTLSKHLSRAKQTDIHARLSIENSGYGVITLHRPSNVDSQETLEGIFAAFRTIQEHITLVFCMHPRTRQRAEDFDLLDGLESLPNVRITGPLSYLDFLHLMARAEVIFTDSGGMQEEAVILKVPCLTLRDNTERPVTLTHGTNKLVGSESQAIIQAFHNLDEIRNRSTTTPPLWDGQASSRIAAIVNKLFT